MILKAINYQTIIRFVGNTLFLMFIFILLIDPTNNLFHKKDILFLLLVGFCLFFHKPDLSKIPHIIALFVSILIPWTFSVIEMRTIDLDYVFPVFKSIAPSILLLWIREFDLLKLSRIPTIWCCLIIDILFLSIIIFPETESIIYLFVSVDNETIIMSTRWFLGFKLFCMYLKSTVAMIIPLTYYFFLCVSWKRITWKAFIALFIICFYFMLSGTRSTILVPFFLLGLTIYASYRNHPKVNKYIYPILLIGGFILCLLIIILASDTQEISNTVKYGHLPSYTKLFEEHPSYLLTGQGPGAFFYSDGFNKYVMQTEWAYLELIRCFGICSVLIIGIFIYPLFAFWRNKEDILSFSIFGAYSVYLIVAGTNPLLLSSTGMLVLLISYSYREKIMVKSE